MIFLLKSKAMASLERKVKRLQWRSSKVRLVFNVFLMLLIFVGALAVRYYAVEPLMLHDTSMQPKLGNNSLVWICKLPQCKAKTTFGDIVWAKQTNQETLVRKIIGMPGDTVEISDKGRIKTKRKRFMWRGEDSFIESRKFYVPKKGDTIVLSTLNDAEEDYILKLMDEQGVPHTTKTTLWQGNREIAVERIGSTKLGNRPVSLQELDELPWQDRRLIEMQIRQAEPGNAPIKIKRQFFAANDTTPIDTLVVKTDCYYLACEKGNHCVDSRELGFFTEQRILGRYIKEPDIAKKFIYRYAAAFQKKFFPTLHQKKETKKSNKAKSEPVQINKDKLGKKLTNDPLKQHPHIINRPHAIKAEDNIAKDSAQKIHPKPHPYAKMILKEKDPEKSK